MHASSPPPGPLTASLFVEALRAHAGKLVAGALICHALLWTLALAISEPTPDPKIALGLALGREWPLGYPGLPVLAPWLLQAVHAVFPSALVMKVLGPITVALAGWFVFLLARRMIGERHGALATLVMVGVTPVSFPVGALDSALIQMPLVAGMVLAWWCATREGSRAGWLMFGFTAALCFYAGGQGLAVLAVLLVITISGSGKAAIRKHQAQMPMLAALAIFALIAAPRLWWLWAHGFTGLYENPHAGFETAFVMQSYEAAIAAFAGHLGFMLLIAVATPLFVASDATVSFTRAPLLGFPLVAGIALATVPFALVALITFALGIRTTIDAFACLLLYSGLLAFLFAGETVHLCRQKLALVIAIIFLVLPPVLIAGLNFAAPMFGRGLLTNWPAASAAQAMTDAFRSRAEKPLRLLIGPALEASEIALASADRPRIFPNADRAAAPWIRDDTLEKEGAVVFWPVAGSDTAPPASLTAVLPPFTPEAPLSLQWRMPGSIAPVRIGWAIIPPQK
jgi:hypothetical protein